MKIFQIKNNGRGFTLVEMLIVIAIIAILSSLVLVGVSRFRPGAYDAQRISDLQKIQSYLEIYYTKYRAYPSVADWAALQTTLINETGIDRVPNDPLFNPATGQGQSYFYCYSNSDNQSYILGAYLSTNNHSALSDDYDGGISGYSCTAGADCVGDSNNNNFCIRN